MSTYLHAKEGAVQLITPTRSMPNMVSLLVLPPTWNRAHYQWLDDWMCPHRKEAHKNSVVAWSREPHIIPFLYRLIYLVIFYFSITLQIFYPLFSSFSMTGCLLFAEGGQKRGISIDVDLTFTQVGEIWGTKTIEQRRHRLCWLTAVSGRMPSVATIAQLYVHNAIIVGMRWSHNLILSHYPIILIEIHK